MQVPGNALLIVEHGHARRVVSSLVDFEDQAGVRGEEQDEVDLGLGERRRARVGGRLTTSRLGCRSP